MTDGASLLSKWPQLRKLTGKQILDGTERCLGEENEAQLRFLLYLSEVERRGFYELAKKRSLWPYLEETLGFSPAETRLRFYSAQLLLRFPVVAEYLADRRLSMTTLVEMKDKLTEANIRDWCDKASKKSKLQVQDLLAKDTETVLDFASLTAGPAPTITEVAVAQVPVADGTPAAAVATAAVVTAAVAATSLETPGKHFLVKNAPSKQSVKALTKTQAILETTLSNEAARDLEELRDLLSEIFPDRSISKVVGYCLNEVKQRLHKKRGKLPVKKTGKSAPASPTESDEPAIDPESARLPATQAAVASSATPATAAASSAPRVTTPESPAPTAAPQGAQAPKPYKLQRLTITKDMALAGRHRDRKFTRESIPAEVKRLVWLRDGGCCQYELKSGQICGSTYRCEVDHKIAVADGGTNDPSNLRVVCRLHNQRRAVERFGKERIARAIDSRKRARASTRVPTVANTRQMLRRSRS